MKKLIPFLMLSALVVFVGCKDDYDDTEIRKEITDLDKRVTDLEGITSALKLKVDGKKMVTGVTALTGGESGWKIAFDDGTSISITNGKDGAAGADGKDGTNGTDGKDGTNGTNGSNGADGKDGVDGGVPYIYVDAEGYWCMNYTGERPAEADPTERMLDPNGDPISSLGEKGDIGAAGNDGTSQYIHIRYSDTEDGSSGISDIPKAYVGIAVTETSTAPTTADAYQPFSRLQGIDGASGSSEYMHIMYADDATGTNMGPDATENSYYIGITTSPSTTAPESWEAYEWSKFRGTDGTSQYVHIRYSATADGALMTTESNATTAYLGIVVTASADAPTAASAYEWTRIKPAEHLLYVRYSANQTGAAMTALPDVTSAYIGVLTTTDPAQADDYGNYIWSRYRGVDGIVGEPGEAGLSQYLHIRYSDNADGSEMVEFLRSTSYYIGILVSASPIASNDYLDYNWALFRGFDGSEGLTGADGETFKLYIGYADNSVGTGFSNKPGTGDTYIGFAYSTAETAPTDADAYTWTKYVGEDGANGEDGLHGNTIHIRYSADNDTTTDGAEMTLAPAADTKWIGIALGSAADDVPATKGAYEWLKLVGDNGTHGTHGLSVDIYIRYASSATGTGMAEAWAAGLNYIGFAAVVEGADAPEAGDYTWIKFIGDNGVQGVQGPTGNSMWVRYSANPDGSSSTTAPDTNSKYIGISTTGSSTDPGADNTKYHWFRLVAEDGAGGAAGANAYVHVAYSPDKSAFSGVWQSGWNYIGIYTGPVQSLFSLSVNDFTWYRFIGEQMYVHVAYSATADGEMAYSEPQPSSKYIGIYTGPLADWIDAIDFMQWSLYRGADGANGTDGTSAFVFVRYSSDGAPAADEDMHESWGPELDYIGFAVSTTNTVPAYDSGLWKWAKFAGADGGDGGDGDHAFIHIKYSANNITDTSDDNYAAFGDTFANWIGIVSTNSETAPTAKSAYTWGLLKGPTGPQGPDGIAGPEGLPGQSQYIHARYSAKDTGHTEGDVSETWSSGMKYMSLLVMTDDDTPEWDDFTSWIRIAGTDGTNGTDGNPGPAGPVGNDGNYVVTSVTGNTLTIKVVKGGETLTGDAETDAANIIASYDVPLVSDYGIVAVHSNTDWLQFDILDNTGDSPVTTGYRFGKVRTVPTAIRITTPVIENVIAGYEPGKYALELAISPSFASGEDALAAFHNMFIDYVGDGIVTRAQPDFDDLNYFTVEKGGLIDGDLGRARVTFTVSEAALEQGAIESNELLGFFSGKRFDICVAYPTNPESFTKIIDFDANPFPEEGAATTSWSYSRSVNSFTFTNEEVVAADFDVSLVGRYYPNPIEDTPLASNGGADARVDRIVRIYSEKYQYAWNKYISLGDWDKDDATPGRTVTVRALDDDGETPLTLASGSLKAWDTYINEYNNGPLMGRPELRYSYRLHTPIQSAFVALRNANSGTFVPGCFLEFTVTIPYSFEGTPQTPLEYKVLVEYVISESDGLPSFPGATGINKFTANNSTVSMSTINNQNKSSSLGLSRNGSPNSNSDLAADDFKVMIGAETVEQFILRASGVNVTGKVTYEFEKTSERRDAPIIGWGNTNYLTVGTNGVITRTNNLTSGVEYYLLIAVTIKIDGAVWNTEEPVYIWVRVY